MRAGRSILTVALAALVAVQSAALAYLGLRARWGQEAGATPVVRGKKVAESMGCFACHGPGGGQPIPNPEKEPKVDGSMIDMPAMGATNWPPPSYDPQTELFYLNGTEGYEVAGVAGK